MTEMNNTDRLTHIVARAGIFRHLADGFNYPDEVLVQALAEGAYTTNLADALKRVGLDAAAGILAEAAAEMRVSHLDLEKDYTWMCFASKPRQVYLFESVYREGKLLQESTFQIARLYYEAGLQLSEAFKLPPDHIAVELEFMAFLFFNEAEAVREGHPEKANLAVRLQGEALQKHLMPFGLSVAERMEKHARTVFYRTLARTLRAVLEGSAV
jgi:putative dimethyl sulfoxide reductase chaperone